MNVLERYEWIQNSIAEACHRSGRQFDSVRLLAVTKQQDWSEVIPLYLAGQRDFGENRFPEAMQKKELAPQDCRWHWIGSLQKNKVRKIVGEFVLIHSVDSFELAQKISLVSGDLGCSTRILLQANMSGENSKHGLTNDGWKACLQDLLELPHLQIDGMMTMAALNADERSARQCFANLRSLRDELCLLSGDRLKLPELSMGMSKDFVWAIQEGATIVRVGSVLFSNR